MNTDKHCQPSKLKIAAPVGFRTVDNAVIIEAKVVTKVFKNPKKSPRTRITCACCSESLDIYFSEKFTEINGVMASNDFWRKLFSQLPK